MIRAAACLAALLAGCVVAGRVSAADAAHPSVIELFQSQGCSSCPPANANVMALAGRPDILALSFQVTYWDQLGWKDTFGSPRYTARQWDYARALGHRDVWTPQVVVNGRRDVVGVLPGEIERALISADRGPGGPEIHAAGGQFSVSGQPPPGGAQVWIAFYDPKLVQVPISRGENGGRTLPHRNVVRGLVRLGDWTIARRTWAIPAPETPDLRAAILVQQGAGGPILAAARG
jgi:hypothetical protein